MAFSWLGGSNLIAQAPELVVSAPESLSRSVGESAVFRVRVTGAGAVGYQWRKNGQPIPRANAEQFEIPSVAFSDAGLYTVEVLDEAGKSKVSQPAGLAVNSRKGGGLDLGYLNATVDHEVNAVAVQPDGKIVLAGDFSRINGVRCYGVARLNGDGTLDSQFRTSVNGTVHAVAVQADGHVVLGGEFTQVNGESRMRIARVHRFNGSNEQTWSRTTAADGPVYSIVPRVEGLLVGGAFTAFNGQRRSGVVRLASNGALDGRFNYGTSFNGAVRAIAVDDAGRILVGGGFTRVGSQSCKYLARLLSTGAFDPGFALGGGGLDGEVWSIAKDRMNGVETGKWVVAGAFQFLQGNPRGRVARLNQDGSADLDFGNNLSGANALVRTVAVLADGTAMIGGDFTAINGVPGTYSARLDRAGKENAAFESNTGGFNSQVRAVVDVGVGQVLVAGAFTRMGGSTVGSCVRISVSGRLSQTLGGNQDLFNGWVWCVVPDSQGRLLVGGGFNRVNGVDRWNLVRLLPDGSVDGSFAVGGGPNLLVTQIKIAGNEDIYISGHFTEVAGRVRPYIARLDKDGVLDETFGGDSVEIVPNKAVRDMAIQRDGKVVIIGDFESVGGAARYKVARLKADGRLDLDYQVSGTQGWVAAVELDAEDRALIGGAFYGFNGDSSAINLVRLNQEGRLDTKFVGYGGNNCNNIVWDIVRDSEEKIWISGDFTVVQGRKRMCVARLDREGVLDPSFGAAMEDPLNMGPGGTVRTLAVDSQGRALIPGDFQSFGSTPFKKIARLKPDGSLDPSFSSDGVRYDLFGQTLSLALDAEGRILLSGNFASVNGVPRNRLARLSGNGRLDLSFGGRTMPESAVVNAVAVDSEQRCLVGGEFWRVGALQRTCLARVTPNGTLDGFAPGLDGAVNAVAVQPDGKVLAGGRFLKLAAEGRPYLVRLEASGVLDPTFGDPERRLNGEVHAVALQSDGKVVVGGSFTQFGGVSCRGVVRVDAQGNPDPGFALGLSGVDGRVLAIAVQGDGKILVGGDFTKIHDVACNGLARLNPDGSVDIAFQSGLGAGNVVVRALVPTGEGRVLVGGLFPKVEGGCPEGIARLNSNGGVDLSFAPGLAGAEGGVNSVAVDADGRIVLGGSFERVHGVARGRLARLQPDGTLDLAFSHGMAGADAAVRAVAVSPVEGSVYAGGEFRVYNGDFRNSFVRVYDSGWDADLKQLSLSEGRLDPVFVPGNPDYRMTAAAPDLPSVRVQTQANERSATVRARINGGGFAAVDGQGRSQSLPFAGGENRVEVLVTSRNGKVSRTYSVGATSQQPVLELRYGAQPLARVGATPVLLDCGSGLQWDLLDRELTVVNIGSGPLVLGAVTKLGADAESIFVGQPDLGILSPGESTKIPLRMTFNRLGVHEVQLRVATNVLVDNNQCLLQVRWTGLDRTLPETTLTEGPAGFQRRTSVLLSFEGQDNVGVAFYEGRLNGGPWGVVSSPYRIGGLTDGVYQFEVRAVDFHGNRDATPAGTQWTVQSYVALKGSSVPRAGVDPRIPAGSVWESFGIPSVNANGTLAFLGTWSSSSKVRETGLFTLREGGEAVLRLKTGEAAVGAPGTVYRTFLDPLLADDDAVIVPAILMSGVKGKALDTSVDRGLWRIDDGPRVTLLAREGDAAGGGGMRWSAITSVAASRGVVAFTGTLVRGMGEVTGASDTGLWVYDAKTASLRLVLREGDTVLGSPVKVLAALAGRGPGAGHGGLVCDEASGAWKISLRVTLKDGRHVLAVVQPPAELKILPWVSGGGTGVSGETWQTFGIPIQNGEGGLVFGAELKRVGLRFNMGSLASALPSESGTGPVFLHRSGESVPGLNGGIFKQFGDPVAASADTLAFGATLHSNPVFGLGKGSDQVVCWKRAGQLLKVVARTGGQAVWAADEALHLWKTFDSLAMADADNGLLLVGTAVPAGAGRSAKAVKALWAGGDEGRLVRLARVGEARNVGGKADVLSNFDVLSQVLGSPCQQRSFNGEGQVVVREFYSKGGQALRVMRYRD
jgi:uncharacterized delta-60 repeat protein